MNLPSVTFVPFDDYHQALEHASELWGVQNGYWDIWGNYHAASPDVQRAILESLGVAATRLEDLNREIEGLLWSQWNSVLPPVLMVDQHTGEPHIPVRLPSAVTRETATLRIQYEDGVERTGQHSLAAIPAAATAFLRGTSFQEKHLPIGALPLGYHEAHVAVEVPGDTVMEATAQLICAPEKAYQPRELANAGKRAGLYVSVYGLRSERSWGCGDFTDLQRLSAWAASAAGASFVALNPLHAIHNRQPFNTSPYLPNSIFYQNLIYLDIDRIEDLARSAWGRRLRESAAIRNEIEELNRSEFVEYERVHRLKRTFLRLAFRSFLGEWRQDSVRSREFREFIEREGDLLDRFAVYTALDEAMHRRDPNVWVWPEWPAEYQSPDTEAVLRFAQSHWRSVLFHKYTQWQIDRQLAEAQAETRSQGLSIGLFHDLALATDRCGSDLWAHRDFFVAGCRVGAPPDDFAPNGQDWSFPPPSSLEHWRDGYRLFRESIRKSCRHGGALRIDHVMRFFRLFWIPAGKEAAEGSYVRDRHEDLVRVLALESVRNKVVIIGEDLGTVDPEIRKTLARFGILSYRLFYFERHENGELKAPAEYPPQALVSSTTHDLPTLAGFWQGRDIEARRRAGVLPDDAYHGSLAAREHDKQKMLDALHGLKLLPSYVSRRAADLPELTGELHNAVIGFLASTPSMLLALNQEDLTKETEQQNLPGTTAQYPNWRRKMRYTLEELESSKTVADFAAMFRDWLGRTGRLPG